MALTLMLWFILEQSLKSGTRTEQQLDELKNKEATQVWQSMLPLAFSELTGRAIATLSQRLE